MRGKILLVTLIALAMLLSGCEEQVSGLSKDRPAVSPVAAGELPRTFLVDGNPAPLDWVSQHGPSIRVTGFISGAVALPYEDRVNLQLTVRQQFRSLTVFHVVPILGDGLTQVIDGATSSPLRGDIAGNPDDLEFRYLTATLSPRGDALYADRLQMTGRTQEWNGANNYTEFPPEPDVGGPEMKMLPGERWLAVEAAPSTSLLIGYPSGLTESFGDSEQFENATFDLYAPDRLAGVEILHVARVITPSERQAQELRTRMDGGQSASASTVAVKFERDRLVYAGVQ